MGATRVNPMQGKHHSEETKKKIADARKPYVMENHPGWKGGKRINHNGYVEVRVPEHPRARGNGYVFEHILVAEEKLGRPLDPNEVVHHRNKIKTDNSPENIEVIMRGEHSHLHARPQNRVVLICPVCGKTFSSKPSHVKNRTTCSFECAGVLFAKYYTGKPRDHKVSNEEKEAILCSIK